MKELTWKISRPPLPDDEIMNLIRLWRTEWKHGDFDWIASLSGDYAETLRLSVVTAYSGNQLAATATAVTREGGGDVALISSVLTDRAFRGRGLGAESTQRAVAEAQTLGARVCFLGTNAWPKNVYQKIGFTRWNGIVMRYSNAPEAEFEGEWFKAEQQTTIREANWGDAPAFVSLVIQPLETFLLSFRRALLSAKHVPLRRCVSNFAPLFTDCTSSGGKMLLLAGGTTSRIFGFAAWGRLDGMLNQTGWIEAAAHDNYTSGLPRLIEAAVLAARDAGITRLIGCAHSDDHAKLAAYESCGFARTGSLSGAFCQTPVPGDLVVLRL